MGSWCWYKVVWDRHGRTQWEATDSLCLAHPCHRQRCMYPYFNSNTSVSFSLHPYQAAPMKSVAAHHPAPKQFRTEGSLLGLNTSTWITSFGSQLLFSTITCFSCCVGTTLYLCWAAWVQSSPTTCVGVVTACPAHQIPAIWMWTPNSAPLLIWMKHLKKKSKPCFSHGCRNTNTGFSDLVHLQHEPLAAASLAYKKAGHIRVVSA